VAGGREYGDGLRRWSFEHNGQRFFVTAVKSYMSAWSIQVGRYRTQQEIEALCKEHRIQGNIFDRQTLHHETLHKSATLPALNKRLNQVWQELVAKGIFEEAQS
jgi:hypothetical protein